MTVLARAACRSRPGSQASPLPRTPAVRRGRANEKPEVGAWQSPKGEAARILQYWSFGKGANASKADLWQDDRSVELLVWYTAAKRHRRGALPASFLAR